MLGTITEGPEQTKLQPTLYVGSPEFAFLLLQRKLPAETHLVSEHTAPLTPPARPLLR